jgi:hypothetical protein
MKTRKFMLLFLILMVSSIAVAQSATATLPLD